MKVAAAIKLIRTIVSSSGPTTSPTISAILLRNYGIIECRGVGSVRRARLLAIAKQAHDLINEGYTEDFMAYVDGRRMIVSASNEAGTRRVCKMPM